MFKYCSLCLFVLFASFIKTNAQVVWDGGAGTPNWGDFNNWNPNRLPTQADDVVINPDSKTNLDLIVVININNAVCKNLTLNGPLNSGANNQATFVKFLAGSKLTIAGKLIMNGSGNRTSGIDMADGGYFSCGGWDVSNNNPEFWDPGKGTVEITAPCILPQVNLAAQLKFGNFNNLIINAPNGTVNLGQNIFLTGNLQINNTSIFDVQDDKSKIYSIDLKGNWINNGTFQPGLQNVTFSGSSDQTISGSSSTTFNNLALLKNGSSLWLAAPVTINGNLAFSNGLINTSPVNKKNLTFNTNATYTGAGSTAFVSGPVQKIGNTEFTFPIGKETLGGRVYASLGIANLGVASSTFTSEYFPVSALTWGRGRHPDIKYISNCEYWQLNRDAGTATPDVTLSWNSSNICAGPSYITQVLNIKVACFNTTNTNPGTWDAYGGTSTGTATSGSVTLKTLTSFVPLTLASIASLNPLPIRFANLTATGKAAGVQVAFSNMTEEDVAKYYIERSADGNQFSVVGSLAPRLNNNQRVDYIYLDAAPLYGDNYYRIRGVETTGKTIHSDVVRLVVNANGQSLHIYPNPARVNSTVQLQLGVLPAGKYQLQVYNQQGQVVRVTSFGHNGGKVSTPISTMGLTSGRYLVELSGAQKWVRTLVLH